MGSIYKAVIVENRTKLATDAIARHMPYLQGWDCKWVNNPSITSGEDYNRLLTTPSFWEQFIHHDKVLIFQHDSGILRKGIEYFLEWDYVGAPWKVNAPWARPDRAGGNGGFSLRCPKKSLDLCSKFPYSGRYGNEDVYFTHHLEKVGGKVAPYKVCKKFSVETEYQTGTFGYHAIDKHLTPKQCDEILNDIKI